MAKTLGDYEAFKEDGGMREQVVLRYTANIGATGAPTATAGSHPGVSLVRTGVGAYTLNYPPTQNGVVEGFLEVAMLKTTTIWHVQVSAIDMGAGTATVTLYNNAATPVATEAANGDVVGCVLVLHKGKVP